MLSATIPNTNRDLFGARATVPRVHGRLRNRVIAALVACLLGMPSLGCGPASSDRAWAEATARTCASTIARAHLRPPSAAQIAPERFLAERQRLLDSHRAFNTVSAFRTVCSRIRDEIRAEAGLTGPSAPTSTVQETTDSDS